jgi:hypothetical protein
MQGEGTLTSNIKIWKCGWSEKRTQIWIFLSVRFELNVCLFVSVTCCGHQNVDPMPWCVHTVSLDETASLIACSVGQSWLVPSATVHIVRLSTASSLHYISCLFCMWLQLIFTLPLDSVRSVILYMLEPQDTGKVKLKDKVVSGTC